MPRASVETNPRFTLDIPPQDKARLMRAAAAMHVSLKEFMLGHALRAADAVLERHERIALSERDTQKVLQLLDNPRPPNPRMVAALRTRDGR